MVGSCQLIVFTNLVFVVVVEFRFTSHALGNHVPRQILRYTIRMGLDLKQIKWSPENFSFVSFSHCRVWRQVGG